jgi:hypothetical protein
VTIAQSWMDGRMTWIIGPDFAPMIVSVDDAYDNPPFSPVFLFFFSFDAPVCK